VSELTMAVVRAVLSLHVWTVLPLCVWAELRLPEKTLVDLRPPRCLQSGKLGQQALGGILALWGVLGKV
jgi:hypothetical protein